MKLEKILQDFKNAYAKKSAWTKEAKTDFEFYLGEQWSQDAQDSLEEAGVKPLTINKIKPMVDLILGTESQNRTDYMAFPEGDEDSIAAEIVTRLMKYILKNNDGNYKTSEAFEHGIVCGEGFLEPFLDYREDLLNAKFKLKVSDAFSVFPDPSSKEYDLSDARFVCKLTTKLTLDQLKELFPEKIAELDKVGSGEIQTDEVNKTTGQAVDPYSHPDADSDSESDTPEDNKYDLLEYFYKKYVPTIFLVEKKLNKIKEIPSEKAAQQYADIHNKQNPGSVVLVKKVKAEIWVCSIVGEKKIEDEICWSYPKWKGYPFIPYYAYKTNVKIKETKALVQGLVRAVKDLQVEFNKRRTQELRILNSSANSGWQIERGAVSKNDEKTYKDFGATPGVLLYHNPGKNKPEKILPTQLSQGHAQLAIESSTDIKEASGINTDLLAANESQSSGRAIYLRQKQGLVMIQRMMDNYSRTKKILGKFIVSQIGEVFTVEKVMRILGEAFLQKTPDFQVPQIQQVENPLTGEIEEVPAIDPMTGQPIMQYDESLARAAIEKILTDEELGKVDVTIGEGASNETIKFANYMTLMDLQASGVPIPPDVIVEESLLNVQSKEKIKKSIESAPPMPPK